MQTKILIAKEEKIKQRRKPYEFITKIGTHHLKIIATLIKLRTLNIEAKVEANETELPCLVYRIDPDILKSTNHNVNQALELLLQYFLNSKNKNKRKQFDKLKDIELCELIVTTGNIEEAVKRFSSNNKCSTDEAENRLQRLLNKHSNLIKPWIKERGKQNVKRSYSKRPLNVAV